MEQLVGLISILTGLGFSQIYQNDMSIEMNGTIHTTHNYCFNSDLIAFRRTTLHEFSDSLILVMSVINIIFIT